MENAMMKPKKCY